MSVHKVLETAKAGVIGGGFRLVAEDVDRNESYLPADQFVVADSAGNLFRVTVDEVGAS